MSRHKHAKLKIDPEFKALIPPLSIDERKQLEENIITEGCREAICIWHGIILDGHNRYEICTKHGIPFNIRTINVTSREEAVAWICANQLGRRNISDETRKYLIGKRYEAEKTVLSNNRYGRNQHSERPPLPDSDDDDDAIERAEGIEPEEVEIEAEDEHDAAEIELMNEDMDNDPDVADEGVIEMAADLEDEKELEED